MNCLKRLTQRLIVLPLLLIGLNAVADKAADRLEIPAYTGYSQPDSEAVHFSEDKGVTNWNDPDQSINWYGHFTEKGAVKVQVTLRLPEGAQRLYRLTMAGTTREVNVNGAGVDQDVSVDFGTFELDKPGYHAIELRCVAEGNMPLGNLKTLTIAGPAIKDAHFNLKPRRNSSSIHLSYPAPEGARITKFYSEVTAVEVPRDTFYMAAGWSRGYPGMQVINDKERRIIFSVWDAGGGENDPNQVEDSRRVRLIELGEDVYTRTFGGEGSGGHSHLEYMWKTGEAQKFLVTAEVVDVQTTVYSGYYFHPEEKQWVLISSWNVPHDGKHLIGLHSFCENFWGPTGHYRRKAVFSNQWAQDTEGKWTELTRAIFTTDQTANDRLDREGGTIDETKFYLATGGFTGKSIKPYTALERKPTGDQPEAIVLPQAKE